jgi:hypothetical protein
MFFGFMNFVEMHYTMSQRDDTDFWKYMTSAEIDFTKINSYKQVMETRKSFGPEFETESGVHCIATGQGYTNFNNISKTVYDSSNSETNFDLIVESFIYRTSQVSG